MQRAVDALGPWLAGGLGFAAAGVFLIRLALPAGAGFVLPLLIAGFLLPFIALPRALRRRDETWHLAGELDRRTGSQGLAMAASAGLVPAWDGVLAQRLNEVPLAPIAWRAWRSVPVALLCLLVALAIPQVEHRPPTQAAGAAFVQPIVAKAQALKDQGLAPDPEAERLLAEAKRLEDAVAKDGLDALRWEALDRLAKATDAAGDLAARRLAEAIAAAADSAALDANAGTDAATAATADLAAALDALAQAAPGLAGLDPETAKALAEAAAAAAQAGKLDPELAQRLAKAAKAGNCQGGKCDAAALARLAKAAQMQLDARRAILARQCLDGACQARLLALLGECQGKSAGAWCPNGRPGGKGGGGPAPLTKVDREAAPVGDAEGLPPSTSVEPDGSVTFATTRRDPEPGEVAAAARAAARAFDPAAADARRAAVAPRHRAAVAQYFSTASAPVSTAPALAPAGTAPVRSMATTPPPPVVPSAQDTIP